VQLLTGKQTAERVRGILHPKYQVHACSVHLTVKNLYSVDPLGKIDFGGSEYEPAGKIAIIGERRRPEDTYSWWKIGRGAYFVEFNETLELAADEMAILEPDERLVRAGGSHPTVFLRGHVCPLETLLEVGVALLQIKQNARISQLRLFHLDTPTGLA
jgi:deoxycytidine triphosphate deaminase